MLNSSQKKWLSSHRQAYGFSPRIYNRARPFFVRNALSTNRPPWDFPLAGGQFLQVFLGWHPDSLGVGEAAAVFFCKLFGCKDFRGMILPLLMIRVRQSWDTEARVFARRRNTFSRQAVAPLGGVLNDRSGSTLRFGPS